MELPSDPAMTLQVCTPETENRNPNDYLYVDVCSRTIHNSQKADMAQLVHHLMNG